MMISMMISMCDINDSNLCHLMLHNDVTFCLMLSLGVWGLIFRHAHQIANLSSTIAGNW